MAVRRRRPTSPAIITKRDKSEPGRSAPRKRATTTVVVPRPAPVKSARNARTNKPVREPDPSGKIAHAIMDFCNELGYGVVEVWTHWCEYALCLEWELRLKQSVAEAAAWRDLKTALDKRDRQQEDMS